MKISWKKAGATVGLGGGFLLLGAGAATAGATAGSAELGLAALARTGAGLTAPTLVGLLLLPLGWALRRGGRRLVTS